MADENETTVEEALQSADEAIADAVEEVKAVIPSVDDADQDEMKSLKKDLLDMHEEMITLRKRLDDLLPQPETTEESGSDEEGALSEAETPEVAVLDEVVPEPPARKKFIPGRRRR